jgi:AAHS family 4-hydroxybenzoate transporter-like MFS transporter
MPSQSLETRTLDPGKLIDEGTWSTYQKLLVFGTAATIIVDGLENQLPQCGPRPDSRVGFQRADFTLALAVGPFGMMIGGLVGVSR